MSVAGEVWNLASFNSVHPLILKILIQTIKTQHALLMITETENCISPFFELTITANYGIIGEG